MNVSPDHVSEAQRLTETAPSGYAPAAEGFIRAVGRMEEAHGGIRTRCAALHFDNRIQTYPALGLTPEEAEAHAYDLLVVAHALRTRTEVHP